MLTQKVLQVSRTFKKVWRIFEGTQPVQERYVVLHSYNSSILLLANCERQDKRQCVTWDALIQCLSNGITKNKNVIMLWVKFSFVELEEESRLAPVIKDLFHFMFLLVHSLKGVLESK